MIYILGYFLLLIAIGALANRRTKTVEDFFIAGRKLPFFLAVPTIVATWYGAGSCMGVSAMVYDEGFSSVIADPFGCSLALLIGGLFFAAKFRKLRLITISDLLGKVYGRRFESVGSVLMLPLFIGTLAAQMIALGYILSLITQWNTETCIIICSLTVVTYTSLGGMWAVSFTDLFQLCLLIVGLLLLLPISMANVGDFSMFKEETVRELGTLLPSDHTSLGWLTYLGQIFMTGCGAIMGQDLIQRSLSCKDARTAKWSTLTAALLYLILGTIPLLIGLSGRWAFPNLEDPNTLMLSLAQQGLSPALFLLFCFGILSAVMSTADSYLLAGTSLFVQNILSHFIYKPSEKAKMALCRYASFAIAITSLSIALCTRSIFQLMVHSGATLFVAIFVPVTAALYWKKANPRAAWASLISGTASWLGSIFFFWDGTSFPEENFLYAAATIGGAVSLLSYIIVTLVPFFQLNRNPENVISIS